jgi:hypothetical protein
MINKPEDQRPLPGPDDSEWSEVVDVLSVHPIREYGQEQDE